MSQGVRVLSYASKKKRNTGESLPQGYIYVYGDHSYYNAMAMGGIEYIGRDGKREPSMFRMPVMNANSVTILKISHSFLSKTSKYSLIIFIRSLSDKYFSEAPNWPLEFFFYVLKTINCVQYVYFLCITYNTNKYFQKNYVSSLVFDYRSQVFNLSLGIT